MCKPKRSTAMNSRVRIRAGGLSVLDKMLLGALDEKIAAGDQGGGMTLARRRT